MKKSLLALTLLAAAPFAASAAEGVSYNYVEGGYTATNLSDGLPDADGWGAKGSVAIAPNFHLFGGYSNQEIDNTNIDYDQWKLGVGYNYEISPKADLVTDVPSAPVTVAPSGRDTVSWSAAGAWRTATPI